MYFIELGVKTRKCIQRPYCNMLRVNNEENRW
jgi:hypothetical protein